MASERFWRKALQPFATNGTSAGVITVVDVSGFKVKAEVIVNSSVTGPLTLQIKNIPNKTTIEVGPASASMSERVNVSAFLVADGATITQARQKRPAIGPGEIDRAVYEEEPTVARRVVIVNEMGDIAGGVDNPINVSIDGGSIDAQIAVALDHRADHPKVGDLPDSVRIGDGINEMHVNPDGSINVNVSTTAGAVVSNIFSQITSVPSGSQTDVLTYTVPMTGAAQIVGVEIGGTDVAAFEVYADATLIARRRLWFGGNFGDTISFAGANSGVALSNGQVVKVKVLHNRPTLGDFEARLLVAISNTFTVSMTNVFSQALSVPSGAQTNVLTYTVPAFGKTLLTGIEIGGTNVAAFEVYAGAILLARRRLWFGGDFSDTIEFALAGAGLLLTAGQLLTVKVLHSRPSLGDFEARLLLSLS